MQNRRTEIILGSVTLVAAVFWSVVSSAQGGPPPVSSFCYDHAGCTSGCQFDYCCCCPIGPIPAGGNQPPRACLEGNPNIDCEDTYNGTFPQPCL